MHGEEKDVLRQYQLTMLEICSGFILPDCDITPMITVQRSTIRLRRLRFCLKLILNSIMIAARIPSRMTNSLRLNSAEDLYCQPLTLQYRALQLA